MKKDTKKDVSNPGSALGEAIGILIESVLNDVLQPIAEKNDCIYVTSGPKDPRTQVETKLLLRDANGIEYNIDSVIANKRLQPLVLIESKYIRYKKHNRDKGSWVCTAHQSLRKRFSSIRSSVAVLAGSWSKTSKAMMKSFDITLFEIPFSSICEVLQKFKIDFSWDEKDRKKAYRAWNKFISLSRRKQRKIGEMLIDLIKNELSETIFRILSNAAPRNIKQVEIQITTNLGESKIFTFDNVERALTFLRDWNEDEILSTENSPSLIDNTDIGCEDEEK